jgi:hypothetical protein
MADIKKRDERLWNRIKDAENSDDKNVKKCFDHNLKLLGE